MMTTEQAILIRKNWELVKPLGNKAGEIFYQQLFAIAPGVRHLFAHDLRAQQAKLVHMLDYIVQHAGELYNIAEDVRQLGKRHHHYQVLPHHYELVGQALMQTLSLASGQQFTPEIADAWRTAFNTLKNLMIVAQEQERKAHNNSQKTG